MSWCKRRFLLVFCASFVTLTSGQAQEPVCSEHLNWLDATFYRRATSNGHAVALAQSQEYADGSMVSLTYEDADGGHNSSGVLIALKTGINLTFGTNSPKPVEFGEIGMILIPPFEKSAGPFGKPCAIPAGKNIPYSDSDLVDQLSKPKGGTARFHGIVSRVGTHIRYSVTSASESSKESSLESVEGESRYDSVLANFPQDKNVQGWNVYRGQVFLMTVPTGAVVTLASLLEKLAQNTH